MTNKKNLPSIDNLQATAKSIRADSAPSSIEDKLRGFVQHYDALTYGISYKEPLWRARKTENTNGYSNKKDIYYPPAHLTKPGRLNEANNPLLYVSFNQFTTLTEIHAKEGEFVHNIGYSLKNNKPIRTLILGEYLLSHKRGNGNLPGNLGEGINKILKDMKYEAALSFVFMDGFLSSLLTDEKASENKYLYTRILAKILFAKYPTIDAIHYPSIASNGAMNLAIKPDVADNLLEVAGTSVLHVDNIFDYGLYRYSLVKNSKGFKQNGEILWE